VNITWRTERGFEYMKKTKLWHVSSLPTEDLADKKKSKGIPKTQLNVIHIQPVGYPLRLLIEEKNLDVTTDNPRLFESYAKEQWQGFQVKEGDFLFD
jgi:AAA+ superfamily predicted ATPase